MRCLYCGKEIGAFRLLRDQEFCHVTHRKNYGEQLEKALRRFSAPEPPPAGVAPFRVQMPYQDGNSAASRTTLIALGQLPNKSYLGWPLTLDTTNVAGSRKTAKPVAEAIPPARLFAVPAPPAQPVEFFRSASASLGFTHHRSNRRLVAKLGPLPLADRARIMPAGRRQTMRVAAAEAAAILVKPSAALAFAVPFPALRYTAELETFSAPGRPLLAPTAYGRPIPVPAAEPVATFLRASAALCFVNQVPVLRELATPKALSVAVRPLLAPATCGIIAPAQVPEPAAILVTASSALHLVPRAAELHLPQVLSQSLLAADLDTLPASEAFLEAPPECRNWMPAPAAAPVCKFVQASVAEFAPFALAAASLRFTMAADTVDTPHVSGIADRFLSSEPALARSPVHLHTADVALSVSTPPQLQWLAALPAPALKPHMLAGAVPSPALEAAEMLFSPTQSSLPLLAPAAELTMPETILALGLEVTLAPVAHAPEVAPLQTPLQTQLIAASVAPISPRVELRIPSFAVPGMLNRQVGGFDNLNLAPAVTFPPVMKPARAGVRPIPTIELTLPAAAKGRITAAMPEPGIYPVDYHSHPLRSSPVCRPEWQEVRFVPVPPRFAIGPVFEKLEDVQRRQKAPKKEPDFLKILNMPPAKKPPTVVLPAFKIAAGILLASTLWFGLGVYRGNRGLTAREVSGSGSVLPAPNRVLTSEAGQEGSPKSRSVSKGVLGWARHTVAQRAALEITESFRGGMENWGAQAMSYPAGWSRHADGYVESGALALFHPSLRFTDYRMDFFAQIENKSIGWTVRSIDANNYHAMKVSIVEAGLRPFVALVQYDVVNGKAGRHSQTPLNVMVHNHQPMQVAVDVVGSRFVTSIDGEEVDRSSSGLLASGGVGFFSDAGEHARLYWMRVSKNDDWLGHVCAFLAGGPGGVSATAGIDLPAFPRAPGTGDAPVGTLAALGMGLPGNPLTQRARRNKSGRNESWNT